MSKIENKRIESIARELYGLCYFVEKRIVGQPEEVSILWAKANSTRHAHTVNAILNYASSSDISDKLEILLAGGLGPGGQVAICKYLSKTQLDIKWTTFESPNSPYLSKEAFKDILKSYSIRLELSDFQKTGNIFGTGSELYDIIVFTEIAEHLDHSTLLRSLIAIRKRLKENGIVIITTPNLVSVVNRIRFLLGDGDLGYWGDGHKNLENRLWGHIVYYDLKRLTRILEDIGLSPRSKYTFNYGTGTKPDITNRVLNVISLISLFLPNSKKTIFIVAKKTNKYKEVPFSI
jgi:2-polyprenyl-3-methyl-5-hydroxy-6-metoxy-1,4-benzoquinol methylase